MTISRDVTKAIVVFGFRLEEDGSPSHWLKARIDKAAELYKQGAAKHLIFCGFYPLKQPHLQRYPEAEVMMRYCLEAHPEIPEAAIFKEQRSASIPDNWIRLREGFPRLRHITLVTQKALIPRIEFLQRMIYGSAAKVQYVKLPSKLSDFPFEPNLLDDMKCTFKYYIPELIGSNYKPGDFQRLIKPDGETIWDEVRLAHHSCEFWQRKIRHPEFS